LKTDACCTAEALPAHIKIVLPLIEDEIKSKYYGCGSPIPLCTEGLKILDFGCGTGRDFYVMSKLVGPKGFVYGIDMTENQIGLYVMYPAGHAEFETTHQFYLAVREDLLQRARAASAEAMNGDFIAHLLRAPFSG